MVSVDLIKLWRSAAMSGAGSGAKRNAARWSAVVLVSLCAGRTASSQTLLHEFEGEPGQGLGNRVGSAGDVNGDGFADVITSGSGISGAGIVHVYSGFDGRILHTWQGAAGSAFGWRIDGVGDVNGDGFPDVIISAQDSPNGHHSGSARVFSGRDGGLLRWFPGQAAGDQFWWVGGAGDVNGDGFADLIVGGPGSDVAGPDFGIARVFSGFDGSVLHEFYGSASNERFGSAVGSAGDIDADGHADLIVGANRANTSNGLRTGRVTVYSGSDGSILRSMLGTSVDGFFGISVAGAGDVNADGYPDIIVGATGTGFNGPMSGMVQVFSGLDASILHEWHGSGTNAMFGQTVAAMGDLNGDGHADVGVMDSSKTAFIFSGRDGSLLYTFGPDTIGHSLFSVHGARDVNGDGYADIVVGGFNKVFIFSGHEHIVPYCHGDGSGGPCPCGNPGGEGEGCASSSGLGAVLTGTGSASIGNDDLAFHASQLLPGQPALLFAGVNAVNGGNGVHFGDGLRCAGGDVQRLGVQLPDAAGNASYDPSASLRELVPGDIRRYQVWYRDPVGGPCGTGFNLTNGVEVAFSL